MEYFIIWCYLGDGRWDCATVTDDAQTIFEFLSETTVKTFLIERLKLEEPDFNV